jgi:hypothetical protein
MRGARDYAANPNLARQLGGERVGHVVLLEIPGPPAGDIEKAVVHRQIDIGHERRHRLKPLEHGRQSVRISSFRRDIDHLLDRPLVAVAIPDPD